MKPYEAEYKAVIVWLAERMNSESSNKLLKTLEEPPSNTLILLIAERYELIIPTVRSRAQLIKFNKINDEDIKSSLNLIGKGNTDDDNISGFKRSEI